MAPKTIVYNGETYCLYKGHWYFERRVYLHKQVWIDANGPIPDGYHIHHKNGDSLDNGIENLECLSASDHALHHYNHRPQFRINRQHWAASAEGKEILRENMRKSKENSPIRKLTCRNCKCDFETKHPNQRYCSMHCQQNHNWIAKDCEICGKEFKAKKHNTREVRTCSYNCGWALRRESRGLQPHD